MIRSALALSLVAVTTLAVQTVAQSAWTQLAPTTQPSARGGGRATSDGTGLLMFGGNVGNNTFTDELWRFDGTNWTLIASGAGSPPGRDWHSQAYDTVRGRLVVFGGRDANGRLGDTWEWDGNAWTQMSPANSPPNRQRAACTYDPGRGRVVLHGGVDGGIEYGDTWEWDGTNWTQFTNASSPSPRFAHRMVYDLFRGWIVMHGGQSGGQRSPETWVYSTGNWRLVRGAAAPFGTGLENFGMAYDVLRDRCVIQGGFGGSGATYRSKTWDFDGQNWIDRGNFLGAGLTARTGQVMDFVLGLGKTYQFGGFSPSTNFLQETYEWTTPTVASFGTAGAPCPSSAGNPTLTATSLPWGGTDLAVSVGNLPSRTLPFLVVGLSDTTWMGVSLPASLGFVGATGCFLRASPDVALRGTVRNGRADFAFGIPDDPALYGATLFVQGLILENVNLFATARGDATIGGL